MVGWQELCTSPTRWQAHHTLAHSQWRQAWNARNKAQHGVDRTSSALRQLEQCDREIQHLQGYADSLPPPQQDILANAPTSDALLLHKQSWIHTHAKTIRRLYKELPHHLAQSNHQMEEYFPTIS